MSDKPKAFITGGSGFIGQRVIRKLVARGYDVYALARSERSGTAVSALGAHIVYGDITDAESMRESMTGMDVVFHLAAWYQLGGDASLAEEINVAGTRKVLRLAHELGVPRIIYVSTVAVFGDTQGELVDETYYQDGPFLTEYDRTKWLAHYKVALPLIEKGAPITIVMPGGVYGPEDTSIIGDMMRLFYRGLPLTLGADTTITYAHVDDVAEGIILSAEEGSIGESYVLAGPAVSLGEMMSFWAYLLDRREPFVKVPSAVLRPSASLLHVAENVISLPALFSAETTRTLGATYMARADKARQKLGWETRPLQQGMRETFDWIAQTENHPTRDINKAEKEDSKTIIALQPYQLIMLVGSFLLLWWLRSRRKK